MLCYVSAGKDVSDRWYEEVKQYNFNRPGFSSGTGETDEGCFSLQLFRQQLQSKKYKKPFTSAFSQLIIINKFYFLTHGWTYLSGLGLISPLLRWLFGWWSSEPSKWQANRRILSHCLFGKPFVSLPSNLQIEPCVGESLQSFRLIHVKKPCHELKGGASRWLGLIMGL